MTEAPLHRVRPALSEKYVPSIAMPKNLPPLPLMAVECRCNDGDGDVAASASASFSTSSSASSSASSYTLEASILLLIAEHVILLDHGTPSTRRKGGKKPWSRWKYDPEQRKRWASERILLDGTTRRSEDRLGGIGSFMRVCKAFHAIMLEAFVRSTIPPIVLFDKAVNADNRRLIKLLVSGTKRGCMTVREIEHFFAAHGGKRMLRLLYSDRFTSIGTIFGLRQIGPLMLTGFVRLLARHIRMPEAKKMRSVRIAMRALRERVDQCNVSASRYGYYTLSDTGRDGPSVTWQYYS